AAKMPPPVKAVLFETVQLSRVSGPIAPIPPAEPKAVLFETVQLSRVSGPIAKMPPPAPVSRNPSGTAIPFLITRLLSVRLPVGPTWNTRLRPAPLMYQTGTP